MKILGWPAENAGVESRLQNKTSPAIQRGARTEIRFTNASRLFADHSVD